MGRAIFRWQVMTGVVIGLAAALAVAAWINRPRPQLVGAMVPDCGGVMRAAVMQYAKGSTFVFPVYKQFLAACPADVEIVLACPDEESLAELRAGVGEIRQKLTPVFTRHTMTAWSRDRWAALMPINGGTTTTILRPRPDANPAVWAERAGDEKVALDLALALYPRIAARTSVLFFDGGDLLADGGRVYVTPAVAERNVQHAVATREELLEVLRGELSLPATILDGAPPHHAGMYMMAAGNKTMVVADPSLGAKYLPEISPELLAKLPNGPDVSPASQKMFDAVAERLRADGYRVVRVPVVPDLPARVYLTYVNVILDGARSGGGGEKPTCYLPQFRGAEAMNEAARKVWESVGYQVVPIDCTDVFIHGGTLHCLVNVFERG